MSILTHLKCPVFKAEGIPNIDVDSYILRVDGMVKAEKEFSLNDIKSLPFSRISSRLTSVSGWSVRADWDGITWNDFIKEIQLTEGANHATFYSHGGYTTTVSLKDLSNPRVMLVYGVAGEPLEAEYGGPLRTVIPNLWGYKSCKWLVRIEFCDEMRGGYWEDRGYNRSGIIEPSITFDVNTRTKCQIKGGEITEF
jgi:DMSO/TMAO reductase YedYZ molybdopterin-dependent catalytic subunit